MPALELHVGATLAETMQAVEKVLKDHEDTELQRVSLTFSLRHDLQAREDAGGQVAVAVGPASVGLNYARGTTRETDSNLTISIDVGKKGLSLAPPAWPANPDNPESALPATSPANLEGSASPAGAGTAEGQP